MRFNVPQECRQFAPCLSQFPAMAPMYFNRKGFRSKTKIFGLDLALACPHSTARHLVESRCAQARRLSASIETQFSEPVARATFEIRFVIG
jgi:hypothetical protein